MKSVQYNEYSASIVKYWWPGALTPGHHTSMRFELFKVYHKTLYFISYDI